jgi:hypothetical protein
LKPSLEHLDTERGNSPQAHSQPSPSRLTRTMGFRRLWRRFAPPKIPRWAQGLARIASRGACGLGTRLSRPRQRGG